MRLRVKILITFFVIFWILLLSRIYYISIKSNTYYEEVSKRNAIKNEHIIPLRGVIKDINGEPLAINKLGFSISLGAHLSYKSKKEILEQELDFIVLHFPKLDKEKLKKAYLKQDSPYNHKPIVIIDFIPYNDIISKFVTFSTHEYIQINPTSKRFYPFEDAASHIIGYVAKANKEDVEKDKIAKLIGYIGKTGIEKQYNKLLEGELGLRKSTVTAYNKEVHELEKIPPTKSDIKLTVDIRLQQYIESLFTDQSGAAIVMDIKTGALLSAVSYPGFDLNKFVSGISQKEWSKMITDLNHPFTNKFIKGLYPPGSTIKMGMALSFLNSKQISEDDSVLCSGEIQLGKRKFRCWKSWGHGRVDLNRALRESCDDYFYKGSLRVGINKLSTDLKRYGFGEKTGVDLPNEFIGTLPNREWKKKKYNMPWYQGETLNTSIGQGYFLATPLQIAKYTALMATGKDIIPHFIYEISDEKIDYKASDNIFNTFEKGKLPLIQKGMYEVCNHPNGTASKYIHSKVMLAGKTGTAQVVGISQQEKTRMKEEDMEYYRRSHAWLTTYAPFENPRYIVTILVEHGGHGGSAAGPMASKIYDMLVDLNYIKVKQK